MRIASVCLAVILVAAAPQDDPRGYGARGLAALARLTQCTYVVAQGSWSGEGLWQSGNTLETLADLAIATANASLFAAVMQNSYDRTPPVVDQCFDDHQWWLLAWVRAYESTGVVEYLQRAAQVFDYVVEYAWTAQCGGGVIWCPVSPGTDGYKNAITNELFLTSAMKLHPYTALVGKPAGFYLSWAQKEWNWFAASGMVNAQGLVNDGLGNDCRNNNQTTWTYNQGVFLNGAALLSNATGNSSALNVASSVASAAMTLLVTTPGGLIMQEPCQNGNCDGDQNIFKGVFARHLSAMLQLGVVSPALEAQGNAFIAANAASVLANSSCGQGDYGLLWQGPCGTKFSVASTSAAADLFVAASLLPSAEAAAAAPAPPATTTLGLGNCVDAAGASMPNCYNSAVTEAQCAAAMASDAGAVAYDFMQGCAVVNPDGFCRVRTLSGASSCPSGWDFDAGSASNVSATNWDSLTVCVLKA